MTINRVRARWAPAIYLLMMLFGAAHADDSKSKNASSDGADLDRIFPRSTLQIATPDARLHTFDIWVAEDEQRRARGLMFVKHLGPSDGMLFIYPDPQPIHGVRGGRWQSDPRGGTHRTTVAQNHRVRRSCSGCHRIAGGHRLAAEDRRWGGSYSPNFSAPKPRTR